MSLHTACTPSDTNFPPKIAKFGEGGNLPPLLNRVKLLGCLDYYIILFTSFHLSFLLLLATLYNNFRKEVPLSKREKEMTLSHYLGACATSLLRKKKQYASLRLVMGAIK